MTEYAIYVRDANRNLVAEVDDFRVLEMVPRFNKVGNWALEVPRDSEAASYLIARGAGILVQRDGLAVISGPVRNRRRKWNDSESVLTVYGPDDLCWLADVLAPPVPAGPPYSGSEHDVRTGVASTVIRQYVDVNRGPSAKAERQYAGLTLAADPVLGSSVTGRARFGQLLVEIQQLAIAGGDLGFRVVQVGTDLQFQIYLPTDRSASVVFSPELGNLLDYEYSEEAPEANYVICAGSGEGTARVFAEKGDSTSIVNWGRIEMFRDRRDTGDAAELMQTIDEELAQKAERFELKISPVDTELVSYLTDYALGDKVTVVVDDEALADVVREVRITLTRDRGETLTPTIGTPGLETLRQKGGAADLFRQLWARVSHLERR